MFKLYNIEPQNNTICILLKAICFFVIKYIVWVLCCNLLNSNKSHKPTISWILLIFIYRCILIL